jgi:hypothetical protein
MYDISCLYNKQTPFSSISSDAFNSSNPSFVSDSWSGNSRPTIIVNINVDVEVYGTLQSTQQNGVLTPVWDITSYGNNENVIMYGQEVNSGPSSGGTSNVNSVEYKTSPNGWATSGTIYNVNPVQAPLPSGVSSSLDLCLSCLVDAFLAVHPWQF